MWIADVLRGHLVVELSLAVGFTLGCSPRAFSGTGSTSDTGSESTGSESTDSESTGSESTGGETTSGEVPDGEHLMAAGNAHTCARSDTGALRCWGWAEYGQLGHANTNDIGDNETPASAGDIKVGGTVVEVVAGQVHTCARLDDGAVRCWGAGNAGQLGYANTNNVGGSELPASVGNVDVGWPAAQLSAGGSHTCALSNTGAVRCWGIGGVLGYANMDSIGDDETPASAGDVDVGGVVVSIDSGGTHTCALLDTGAVRCWGYGEWGQLGYANTNSIGDDETPASVGDVDVGGKVVEIAVGEEHTCARLDDGAIRCWGWCEYGRLGYGYHDLFEPGCNIGDDETPAAAGDVDVGWPVVEIIAGWYHTCALSSTGALRCWGSGGWGQLGHASLDDIWSPASADDVDVGGVVVELVAGGDHTCARLNTGSLRCWGSSRRGQLGYANEATIGDDETPASAGDVQVF